MLWLPKTDTLYLKLQVMLPDKAFLDSLTEKLHQNSIPSETGSIRLEHVVRLITHTFHQ